MQRARVQTSCMSDQALAWKAGFGALVLVFCAGSYVLRKPHEAPPPPAPVAVAAMPPAVAPLDVQEDAPPVRIEIALPDPQPAPVARAQVGMRHRVPVMKKRVG